MRASDAEVTIASVVDARSHAAVVTDRAAAALGLRFIHSSQQRGDVRGDARSEP